MYNSTNTSAMPLIDAHFGGFFLTILLYTQQKSVLDQIEHFAHLRKKSGY